MSSNNELILQISATDIETMNFDPVIDLMETLIHDDETISNQEGRLLFDFEDALEDDIEPGEVQELREWVEEVDRAYPYLPYFISRDPEEEHIGFYTSLLVPFTPEGDALKFDKQALERFAISKIQAINSFCTEHNIDPRANIRQFCEHLRLDVIEELVEEQQKYPFEPEKINSKFLIDFFKSGYYFHTIDASDEPVLFALVDEPTSAYYAKAELDIELFSSPAYPVIVLEMTLFDQPESPLKMTFVYNVDQEKHRKELYAYTEMAYLTTNFLFRENDELYYAFTRAVDLSVELRERIRGIILGASHVLRAIPAEARNFAEAVEELFTNGESAEKTRSYDTTSLEHAPNEPVENADKGGKIDQSSFEFVPQDANENIDDDTVNDQQSTEKDQTNTQQNQPKFELSEIENQDETSPDNGENQSQETSAETQKTDKTESINSTENINENVPRKGESEEPEILHEIEFVEEPTRSNRMIDADEAEQITHQQVSDSNIPSSVLPQSIQRITRALAKPVRRPEKSITEGLAVTPAPKKVVLRNEDQLERLSRRLLIMQNKLEQAEREKIRLYDEIRLLRDDNERLQRENLNLESKWWKFWRQS